MAWKLWENGINHIDRSNERNGITDRFNGAVWTRRIQCNRMEKKQIGGIACENCCNCHDHQLWKMFASCINFSWFFWEVLLGESATIRMIAISDIKDWIKIKRNWSICRNWWNENNQINGIDGITKSVGIGSTNENGKGSAVLIWMVELRAWKLWNRWFQSNQLKWWNQWN